MRYHQAPNGGFSGDQFNHTSEMCQSTAVAMVTKIWKYAH